jgi:hypothetical protein
VAGVKFTVLERPLVVEFVGAGAEAFATDVLSTFRDLDARAVGGATPECAPEWTVEVDGEHGDPLLERLSQDLCDWAITERRDDLLMIHAGGLADPATGAAVGLVGPSGAGKSTAVRTLGRRFGYLGDEVLAVDDARRVVPLPKPLSLILPNRPSKAQIAAGDLGLVPAPTEPRLVGLLVLDRRPTATVDLEPIAMVDALALVGPQVSFLGTRPRPLHWLAEHLERVGGAQRVTYEESADLVPVIEALVEGGAS